MLLEMRRRLGIGLLQQIMVKICRHTIREFTNAFGNITKSTCQPLPLQLHLRNKDQMEPFTAFNLEEFVLKQDQRAWLRSNKGLEW